MRRITISPGTLRAALPQTATQSVTAAHIDIMGHMNVAHYAAVFARASRRMTSLAGVTSAHIGASGGGAFMLRNFSQFIAEAHTGDELAVYTRAIARGARRYQSMHFLLNETHDRLAATMEVLTTYADLTARQSAPFPPEVAATLDALIARHSQTDWSDAPLCGLLAP